MVTKGVDPYTHGNSFANGKDTFRMSWEQRELQATKTTIYTFLEPDAYVP
jgi:hypothetical protein